MQFLKNKVFRKVFITYSAIIIASILLLATFISKNIEKTFINNQIYLNKKMTNSVSNYFNQQYNNSKIIVDSLYSKPLELWDICNFLNYDYEKYIKKRLDNYYNFEGYMYGGINSFIKNSINSNSTIKNIIFYSDNNDEFAIFDSLGYIRYKHKIKENISFNISEEETNIEFLNLLKSYDKAEGKETYYYTINKIKDPNSLNTIGFISIKYDLSKLKDIISDYENIDNYIIVLNKGGEVLYDSSGKYNNKKYPFINKLKTSEDPIFLDKYSYVDISSSTSDIKVIGILPLENALKNSKFIIYTIYAISLLLIIIAEIIMFLKVYELSKRVNNIITAMKEVQKGNFKIKIDCGNEDDEFTLISNNFNNMCKKLDEYIDRVYLSEIKQKKAEMLALQNQVNPHFLYNTLEAIRMKAVSNEDRETAKMLYNLSVLYRNMVKGSTFITIKQEIDQCKLYLDLFKFRYEGKIDYYIDIEEKFLKNEIIKFSIQPIIENFVIHGVDLYNDNNFISIRSCKEDNDLIITIEDNGIGMDEEKIKEINRKMQNIEHTDSIGLLNVHERIRLTYGDKYGLIIRNKKTKGTIIDIKIPIKGVDNYV